MISERARAEWHPQGVYLNTASYGLPSDGGWEVLGGSEVMAAARAGVLRTSWHLYNDEEDVERVLALLSPDAERRLARGSGAA